MKTYYIKKFHTDLYKDSRGEWGSIDNAVPYREDQIHCTPLEYGEQFVGIVELIGGDSVNHPQHYGGDNIYEPIKIISAWNLNFNLGNTVKYISRAGKKGEGTLIEDLKKALFYLKYEIDSLEK